MPFFVMNEAVLISEQLPLLQQWQQKERILEQFHQLAHASLLSDPKEKDTLLAQFYQLIYNGRFNSLNGGTFVINSKHCHIPTTTNLYLAEILIAADQVFFRGDFLLTARSILQSILAELSTNKIITNKQSNSMSINELDCHFTHDQISKTLDDNECALLFSLIKLSKPQPDYLIAYRRSLKDAASNIEMPIKQAQILEYSLLNKLREAKNIPANVENSILSKDAHNAFGDILKQDFAMNCNLIIAASSLSIAEPSGSVTAQLKNVFFTLSDFCQTKIRDRVFIVNLIYAGLILLQLDFDLKIIALISSLIEKIPKDHAPIMSDKQMREESIISDVISELSKQSIFSAEAAQVEFYRPQQTVIQTQVIVLTKDAVDYQSRQMNLTAKFHSRRLIYAH